MENQQPPPRRETVVKDSAHENSSLFFFSDSALPVKGYLCPSSGSRCWSGGSSGLGNVLLAVDMDVVFPKMGAKTIGFYVFLPCRTRILKENEGIKHRSRIKNLSTVRVKQDETTYRSFMVFQSFPLSVWPSSRKSAAVAAAVPSSAAASAHLRKIWRMALNSPGPVELSQLSQLSSTCMGHMARGTINTIYHDVLLYQTNAVNMFQYHLNPSHKTLLKWKSTPTFVASDVVASLSRPWCQPLSAAQFELQAAALKFWPEVLLPEHCSLYLPVLHARPVSGVAKLSDLWLQLPVWIPSTQPLKLAVSSRTPEAQRSSCDSNAPLEQLQPQQSWRQSGCCRQRSKLCATQRIRSTWHQVQFRRF